MYDLAMRGKLGAELIRVGMFPLGVYLAPVDYGEKRAMRMEQELQWKQENKIGLIVNLNAEADEDEEYAPLSPLVSETENYFELF